MKKSDISRREFIELTVASSVVVPSLISANAGPSRETLPQRALGRTGVKVPILAFGCGTRFLMYEDEAEALSVLNHVIDSGITYLDTAASYGKGLSETRVGMVMKDRRKDVFLATKMSSSRTRDGVLKEFEQSLKRLQTDHVDLLHLHSLGDDADLAKIEAADGGIKALYELRDQKAARFIGMTSHTDGRVMAKAIEHNDLDSVQMAMNPSMANDFEKAALPAALKKKIGVTLMKATAQEKILGAGPGKADAVSLVRYALSLPVAAAVIGMPKRQFIEENLRVARNFNRMSPQEMDTLRTQVAPSKAALEHFFARHKDAAWV
ncbi:MAG TPA: aldo/keto reductase [Acidobacteriota bacterium]|jgi:hypothetical protein